MQMCTYLQSTNDCHRCRLVLNSVVSFRIGDSLRAGRGERATCHMQTHTHTRAALSGGDKSRRERRRRRLLACIQASRSIFQNVCKDNVEFSFHT
jgi:hypothetical protein